MKHNFLFLFLMLSVVLFAAENKYKYNTQNNKYHKIECKWAKKCTAHCIELTLQEIKNKKGVPCKVCKPQK